MKLFRFLCGVLAALALSGAAHAGNIHGTSPPVGSGVCLGDAYWLVDGCSGAPSNSAGALTGTLYQNTNFFGNSGSGARQSGQAAYTYTPPWYLAGVNWPVGIPPTVSLYDPANSAITTGSSITSGVLTIGTYTNTFQGINIPSPTNTGYAPTAGTTVYCPSCIVGTVITSQIDSTHFNVSPSQSTTGGSQPINLGLPISCAYQLTGNTTSGTGTPRIYCNTSGVSPVTTSVLLDSYDFSLHNCVPIRLATYSGAVHLTRSKFDNNTSGTTCFATPNAGQFVTSTGLNGPITFDYSYINGETDSYPGISTAMFAFNGSGLLTVQYDAFLYSMGEDISSGSTGGFTERFNHFEGLAGAIAGANAHGGTYAGNFTGGTNGALTFSYNVAYTRAADLALGSTTFFNAYGATCNVYPTCATYTLVQWDHNTSIVNLATTPRQGSYATIESSIGQIFGSTYTKVSSFNNYTDCTGALTCGSSAVRGGTGFPVGSIANSVLTVSSMNSLPNNGIGSGMTIQCSISCSGIPANTTVTALSGPDPCIGNVASTSGGCNGTTWQLSNSGVNVSSGATFETLYPAVCSVAATFSGDYDMLHGPLTTWGNNEGVGC